MKKENIAAYVHYGAFAGLSLGVFYWLNHLSNGQIKLLLDFYKNMVEIFFGNYHYFDEMNGYYVGTNYIISESCLGLNIIALIFAVCTITNAGRTRGANRILLILSSGLLAVIIGVFANILRLISSIYFTVFARFELIHALLGIVINLSALIFCYKLSNSNSLYLRIERVQSIFQCLIRNSNSSVSVVGKAHISKKNRNKAGGAEHEESEEHILSNV